jgi:hypothetical protein
MWWQYSENTYKQQLHIVHKSSNNVWHLITKTITTLQHSAKLQHTSSHFTTLRYTSHFTQLHFTTPIDISLSLIHTSPNYTSLHLSTLHFLSFTLHPTTLHYTYRHFTSSHLHFTTLSFSFTFPVVLFHLASLNAIWCVNSAVRCHVVPALTFLIVVF